MGWAIAVPTVRMQRRMLTFLIRVVNLLALSTVTLIVTRANSASVAISASAFDVNRTDFRLAPSR